MEKLYTINQVNGFDPYNYLVPMRDEITGEPITNESGQPRLYLPYKAKKRWFKLKYPDGRILPKEIERDDGQYEFVCYLFANKSDMVEAIKICPDNPEAGSLGKGYALRTPSRNEKYSPYETAMTLAKSAALEDADFGSEVSLWLQMQEEEELTGTPAKAPEPKLEPAPAAPKPSFEVKTAETATADEEALNLFADMGVKGAKSAKKKGKKAKAEEPEPEAVEEAPAESQAEPEVSDDGGPASEGVKAQTEESETATETPAEADAPETGEAEEEDAGTPGEYVITASDVKGVAVLAPFIGKSLEELGKESMKSVLEMASDKISTSFREAAEAFTR